MESGREKDSFMIINHEGQIINCEGQKVPLQW